MSIKNSHIFFSSFRFFVCSQLNACACALKEYEGTKEKYLRKFHQREFHYFSSALEHANDREIEHSSGDIAHLGLRHSVVALGHTLHRMSVSAK